MHSTALAAALGVLLSKGTPPQDADPPTSPLRPHSSWDEPAPPPDAAAQAKMEIGAARAAAAGEDYAKAIVHFERALALRPSAGIHYNIAICHHRVMLAASKGEPAYEASRAAAVLAYNAYLRAAPKAQDRYEVAQTVAELGGRPALLDEWRVEPREHPRTSPPELRESDLDPVAASPEPAPEGEPDDPPALPPLPTPAGTATFEAPPVRPRARFPRGRVGLGAALGFVGIAKLTDTDDVASLPSLGATVRGAGFVTARRELAVGGELAFGIQPSNAESKHRLNQVHVALTADWGRILPAVPRLELGVGVLSGLMRQSLVHNDVTTAACPASGSGAVSVRGGFLAGARFNLLLLLGAKKRHEVGLRVGPAIGLFADGSKGDADEIAACAASGDAFAEFGLDGPNLILVADIGYAVRI